MMETPSIMNTETIIDATDITAGRVVELDSSIEVKKKRHRETFDVVAKMNHNVKED